jgi:hypothetical protein
VTTGATRPFRRVAPADARRRTQNFQPR